MDKKFTIIATIILVGGASYFYFSASDRLEVQHQHESHQLIDDQTADIENQPVYRNGQVLSTGISKLQRKEPKKMNYQKALKIRLRKTQ